MIAPITFWFSETRRRYEIPTGSPLTKDLKHGWDIHVEVLAFTELFALFDD